MHVEWTTGQEVNNSEFIIERSGDGYAFTIIGRVPEGNAAGENNYVFTDVAPESGNNYYRVKQVDNGGRLAYTLIAKVEMADRKYIKLTGNPVRQQLDGSFYSSTTGMMQLQIVSAAGQVYLYLFSFASLIARK